MIYWMVFPNLYTFPIKIIPDALVPLQPMVSILLLVPGCASRALPMIYTSTEMEISYSHALGFWNKQTLKLNLHDIDTKQQIDQTNDCINKMALFSKEHYSRLYCINKMVLFSEEHYSRL